MATMSKTWWGERFFTALQEFTDPGRLQRGRAYAKDHRILAWNISGGIVNAKIRGNVNAYFGVHKEPVYKVHVQMQHLKQSQWKKLIADLTQRAGFIAKLLVGEIPEQIDTLFNQHNTHLLPQSYEDFSVSCDCPDYAVPCKHIAGVCYRLSAELDHNPLLLFELRGLNPEKLQKELIKSPLGRVLAQTQDTDNSQISITKSYFTPLKPKKIPKQVSIKSFWQGQTPLPSELPAHKEASIAATIIKKGGDYPQFWNQQTSFLSVMEDYYLRMRKINQKQL